MNARDIVARVEELRVAASTQGTPHDDVLALAQSLDRGVRVRGIVAQRDSDVTLAAIFDEAEREGIINMFSSAFPVEAWNWNADRMERAGDVTAEQAAALRI